MTEEKKKKEIISFELKKKVQEKETIELINKRLSSENERIRKANQKFMKNVAEVNVKIIKQLNSRITNSEKLYHNILSEREQLSRDVLRVLIIIE